MQEVLSDVRRRGLMTRVAPALALTTALSLTGLTAGLAFADPGDPDGAPTEQEVADARAAVETKATDVESVRAALVVAQQRLQATEIAAAKAAEAFNGARYQAQLAAKAARQAQRRTEAARADVERQRLAYAAALTASYQLAPELGALSAIVEADGVTEVLESTSALQNAEDAIAGHYDAFRAAATLAEVADDRARAALDVAAAAKDEARQARDLARAATEAAAQETAAYAAERDRLIGELAVLEDVSVGLARERQEALEQQAEAAAAAAAQQAAEEAAAEAAAQEEAEEPENPAPSDEPEPEPEPSSTPDPTPTPEPEPEPEPDPAPPPPSGGAAAAIAFAKDQIGEPYKYGASGPNAWDCSGLTMMAWNAGGKSLPHYSVAQYNASTPISLNKLKPGDLLFWGSSGNPSSIYHVALYIGGDQMIHAPRPGRNVEQVSMYYWITPNLFARP